MYDVGQSSLFSILHKTANNLNGTINADPLGKRHGQRTKTFKTYTHARGWKSFESFDRLDNLYIGVEKYKYLQTYIANITSLQFYHNNEERYLLPGRRMSPWPTGTPRGGTPRRPGGAWPQCHVMSCHVMAGVMWPLLAAVGHKNTFVTFSQRLSGQDDSVTQSTDGWPPHHILISTYLKQEHCLCENYYLKLFEIESKSIMKWGLRGKWGNRRNYGQRRSS